MMTNFSFSRNKDLLSNIQLEASAGTGKTYSIERIVALLVAAQSVPLSRILVVTFTRKAARELKDRIRQILTLAAREGALDLGGEARPLSEEEMDNIRTALGEFEKSSILTIHSFCLNMLKAYPFESLSQFSMDMGSGDDLTGEAVRDYMREIGEGMERGQLIKYKAFLEGGSFENAVEKLADALDRELLEPDLIVLPESHVRGEILETVMDFNNSRGDLFSTWNYMVEKIPEESYLKELGFKGTRFMMGRFEALKALGSSPDFISLSKTIASTEALKYLLKFSPQSYEDSLTVKADPLVVAADPFVKSVQDFLDLYLYDEDNLKANLYLRALKSSFLIEAYETIRSRLNRKKDITGKLDFNDLVGKLHKGLCGGDEDVRPEFLKEIRKRYRTVLIDEFQDTDSRQWDIFSTLFGGDEQHNYYLVGDPKQSIYRFRGADLEIYHKACGNEGLDGRYTLGKNFRSISSLVEGVNRIFERVFAPEMHCGSTGKTPFQPVQAGRDDEPRLRDSKAPIEFLSVQGAVDPEKEITGLKAGRTAYYNLIAYKTYELLQDGSLGERKIRPDDIAILTENNSECQTLQELLTRYSIPSVINARQRIFDTEEAGEFLLFLQALIRRDNSSLKLLLLSTFFKYSPFQVQEMEENGELDEISAMVFHWREEVDKGKLIEVSRKLYDVSGFDKRTLSEKNGERAFANMRQILEYLHSEQMASRLNSEELYSLLLNRIKGKSGPDEDLIRLDKDSHAVQIMTMHASKGLEFPIVFFAGALRTDNKTSREDFYDFVKEGDRYYDFLKQNKHRILASMDQWEERKRLYYVALTRASSKLYMPLIEKGELSYLSSLYCSFSLDEVEALVRGGKNFHPFSLPIHSGIRKVSNKKDDDNVKASVLLALDEGVKKLIAHNPGLYSLDENLELRFASISNPYSLTYRDGDVETELVPGILTSEDFEKRYRKISSYSSLIRHAGHHSSVKVAGDADRDDVPGQEKSEQRVDELTRGAMLGELVHLLFEELDFGLVGELDYESFSKDPLIDELFKSRSVRFFNNQWYVRYESPLKRLVYRTLKNGIGEDFALCRLKPHEKLHEMEFHMTVKDCGNLQLGDDFSGSVDEGFLKGFIDLIFLYEGKYYIADWKTTSSPEGDDFDHYRSEVLDEMMSSHHYNLQSIIYTIALYRYLKVTEGENFDYERDYGGCYYFFVRGMSGEADSSRGVHFSRPSEEDLLRFADQFIPGEVLS